MKKVYRVEKEGIGPYQVSTKQVDDRKYFDLKNFKESDNIFVPIRSWQDKPHEAKYDCPDPDINFGINWILSCCENPIFCFLSIKQMKSWFTQNELETLYLYGFQIMEIEVKEIYRSSKHQCIVDYNAITYKKDITEEFFS